MIAVTVGTQLPFDRLVAAMDTWAATHPDEPVFAQIGPSSLRPAHLQSVCFLKPDALEAQCRAARLLVAHAGIGSVLTALRLQKPIVLLPRQAALGEHRNDHQLATARWLESKAGIRVAWEVDQLAGLLQTPGSDEPTGTFTPHAQDRLIERLRAFIDA